ncbi:MAG TPA: fumarylacetoacetate hydrolase family protein [Kofleriaceae bacterium]|jgi:2-keto-4-pentenoate hydratase/2-oxohepta-3-ene-1,7-dioic acid hydratase in catechol pathway
MLVPIHRAGVVEAYDLIPSKIIGIGQNYRAHAAEMGKKVPEEPLIFMKPRSAMIPDGGAIERPPGYEKVDFEGELGVVIGRRARRVTKESALDYVLGYTIVNDVSCRDLQTKDVQYIRAKGFDSFCPIGPRIVPGLAPNSLRLQTRLNGVVKQDSSTSDMIFDVPTLISFCSQYMTLEPGDVISTGTPAGVSNMTPGDVVEIEIEGIGILRNTVIARTEP